MLHVAPVLDMAFAQLVKGVPAPAHGDPTIQRDGYWPRTITTTAEELDLKTLRLP